MSTAACVFIDVRRLWILAAKQQPKILFKSLLVAVLCLTDQTSV